MFNDWSIVCVLGSTSAAQLYVLKCVIQINATVRRGKCIKPWPGVDGFSNRRRDVSTKLTANDIVT